MAKKWSFEEDYIVGSFWMEKRRYFFSKDDMKELMGRLEEEGFTSKNEKSVLRRVQQYRVVCRGNTNIHVPRRIRDIAEALGREQQEMRMVLKRDIAKNYTPSGIVADEAVATESLYALNLRLNDLTHLAHQIDQKQMLHGVLQKYLGLKGLKNKDVYEAIKMKPDTFSKIVCGRYKKVQKINILRLCIGLRLTIQEAEEVMESAGYDFSPSIIEDVIVKYCIINRIYSPTCVNIEFYDSKVKPLLFKI